MSKLLGAKYEELAYQFLLSKQLKLITNNFNCKHGEIDLIMLDKDLETDIVVFTEVRYRKNIHYGHPIETITIRKQNKLLKTALFFLSNNQQYKKQPIRFDVVTILGKSVKIPKNYDITYITYDRIDAMNSLTTTNSSSSELTTGSIKSTVLLQDPAISRPDDEVSSDSSNRTNQIDWYKNIMTDYQLWIP